MCTTWRLPVGLLHIVCVYVRACVRACACVFVRLTAEIKTPQFITSAFNDTKPSLLCVYVYVRMYVCEWVHSLTHIHPGQREFGVIKYCRSDELRVPYLSCETHTHTHRTHARTHMHTRCAKIRPATSTWCTLSNANVGDKRHFSEKCTVKNVFFQSLATR